MELNKLKLKRLCEAKKVRGQIERTTKRLTTDERGRQVYVDQPGTAGGRKPGAPSESVETDDADLAEGKKHKTPDFVRHCVTAITEKPKELARVERDAPGPEKGSPFAICQAKYNDNKRSLAAKHAKGDHHSVKQYEKALATLRDDVEHVRRQNADRRQIMLSDVEMDPTAATRHLIRYVPGG